MKRLFSFIQFSANQPESLDCDNKQTVDLLNREKSVFQTKLRHVDIHQLWIRQEVQAKRLIVKWIKTDAMPADGLTKRLSSEKYTAFVRQLGMEVSPLFLLLPFVMFSSHYDLISRAEGVCRRMKVCGHVTQEAPPTEPRITLDLAKIYKIDPQRSRMELPNQVGDYVTLQDDLGCS